MPAAVVDQHLEARDRHKSGAALVCACRRSRARGLGLGSVCFAKVRKGVPMPSGDEISISAGQRRLRTEDRSRPQRIAITLSRFDLFPMTHHVECVALLEPRRR
jgi:hypothetical protein